jgi:hypothetical protein
MLRVIVVIAFVLVNSIEPKSHPITSIFTNLEDGRVADNWGRIKVCNRATSVMALQTRLEKCPHGKDCVELNALRLICSDAKILVTSKPTSEEKIWPGAVGKCEVTNYIVGFYVKKHHRGINGMRLICENNEIIKSEEGVSGKWSKAVKCPKDTYVCGVQPEVSRTSDSNRTIVENVQLFCCNKTLEMRALQKKNQIGEKTPKSGEQINADAKQSVLAESNINKNIHPKEDIDSSVISNKVGQKEANNLSDSSKDERNKMDASKEIKNDADVKANHEEIVLLNKNNEQKPW